MEKAERRGALRCRFILALLIALGVALALGGLWGDRQYTRAGFTQENAFSVVHSLSGEVGRLYQNGILPTLTASGADAGPLEAAGVSLLSEVWQNQTRAEEALAGFSGEALRERTMKLLATTYTVSGPSIRASPIWLTSKIPAFSLTAICSALMPSYCTGSKKPPNGTIRPFKARCSS